MDNLVSNFLPRLKVQAPLRPLTKLGQDSLGTDMNTL